MSINLKKVLSNPARKKIVQEFVKTKKELDFKYIRAYLNDDTTRPDFHLTKLVDMGILRRIKKRGFYKINEIVVQSLRNYFGETVPICLIGGLGELTLFTDILTAFQQISIIPIKYILITSPDINKKFQNFDKGSFSNINVEICELDYQTILRENYPEVFNNIETIIKKEIYDFDIICELTGGTKVVSVASMYLSYKYNLRKCYFSGRKLYWI